MFFSAFDNTGDKIRGQMEDIARMYGGISLPELVDTDFRPEAMDYELVQEDPMVLQSQLAALEKMQQLADEGLTAEDKLAMFTANRDAGQRAKGARLAATQNANARGVGGSGLEFALSEIANQGAAERARAQSMEQAAASAKNKAMNQMAYSQGLGNVRNQDYQTKANNTGIINQFNSLNTQNRNNARLRNIDQRRANEQGRFQNAMTRADGMAGAKKGIADATAAEGAARREDFNSAIQMGGMLLASDKNLKTDIRNAGSAIDETLENISPYLWMYRDKKFGEGEYVGVMAQDLQKSKAGREIVSETPEGLMLDNQKLLSFLVGTVAHQAKKIKELEARLV